MSETQNAFRLKMRSLTLPLLQVFDKSLMVIEHQLEALRARTPQLFQDTPMIIDVSALESLDGLDVPKLYDLLSQYSAIPVGLQGELARNIATQMGVAFFNVSEALEIKKTPVAHDSEKAQEKKSEDKADKTIVASLPTLLITKPVRSGQQIYAQGCDLVIVSSVSPGAELLADGNIHVYGTLRGRALAGLQGNKEARIFCQALEADLVSIAGFYMVSDTIDKLKKPGLQQIFWADERVHIESIG